MKKTDDLEAICELLHEVPLDGKRIIAGFYSDERFDPAKALHIQDWKKLFSEGHLDVCLEEITKAHPEFKIDLKPFGEPSEVLIIKHGYRFYYDSYGRLIAHPNSGPVFEYDKVVRVAELPVVFEIKIAKWNTSKLSSGGRGKGYRLGAKIKNTLRPEVYNRRLKPIRQLFETESGYVVIIPYDIYHNREPNPPKNSIYSQFKENDGLLVPFYTDRGTFQNDVIKMVNDSGFRLKQSSLKF